MSGSLASRDIADEFCAGSRAVLLSISCTGAGRRAVLMLVCCTGAGRRDVLMLISCTGTGSRTGLLSMSCIGAGSRAVLLSNSCIGAGALPSGGFPGPKQGQQVLSSSISSWSLREQTAEQYELHVSSITLSLKSTSLSSSSVIGQCDWMASSKMSQGEDPSDMAVVR